mgnify:CR=1 FL=1
MAEFDVRIEFEEDRLLGAMKYANKKALRRVGAYVRKAAVNSVHKSKKSSAAGSPPNTRRGLLKRGPPCVSFQARGENETKHDSRAAWSGGNAGRA